MLVRRAARAASTDPAAQRSGSDVFAEVYAKSIWGGAPGEFCSGGGSSAEYAEPYCALVRDFVSRLTPPPLTVVDLGCGDFRVGMGLASPDVTYVGVDVVPTLIDRNRREFEDERTSFVCLDIVADDLPDGDICLVRQVLQHLSNGEIRRILPKLRKYPYVFITEHYPSSDEGVIPNLDKPHGPSTRLDALGSAVYLDRPPFELRDLECVLTVPHGSSGELRTYRCGRRVDDVVERAR